MAFPGSYRNLCPAVSWPSRVISQPVLGRVVAVLQACRCAHVRAGAPCRSAVLRQKAVSQAPSGHDTKFVS